MFNWFKAADDDIAKKFNKLADDKKALEEQVSDLQKQVDDLEIIRDAFLKKKSPTTVKENIVDKLVYFIKLFNKGEVKGYILKDVEKDNKVEVLFQYWREK